MFQKFPFFLFAILIFSCQNEQDKQSASIADDICKCYQPLVELNTEIQSKLKSNEEDEAEDLITKVSSMNEDGKKCTLAMVNKYGANTQINVDQVSAAMKEQCPKILGIVSGYLFEE